MASRSYGQYCGVTSAVELVGERWALLIVRDLLVGPRRYTDLKQGLPRIPTNILSTRLKELQEGGVVRRVPLPRCGLVYELTAYGRELEPVALALGRWGFQPMGDPGDDDVVTADSLTMALRTAFRPGSSGAADYELRVGEVVVRAVVSEAELRVVQVEPAGRPTDPSAGQVPSVSGPADIVIAASPGLRRLISGELGPDEAVAAGVVEVLAGDPDLLTGFAETFRIEATADAS